MPFLMLLGPLVTSISIMGRANKVPTYRLACIRCPLSTDCTKCLHLRRVARSARPWSFSSVADKSYTFIPPIGLATPMVQIRCRLTRTNPADGSHQRPRSKSLDAAQPYHMSGLLLRLISTPDSALHRGCLVYQDYFASVSQVPEHRAKSIDVSGHFSARQ
jgi:hypothetical protein